MTGRTRYYMRKAAMKIKCKMNGSDPWIKIKPSAFQITGNTLMFKSPMPTGHTILINPEMSRCNGG